MPKKRDWEATGLRSLDLGARRISYVVVRGSSGRYTYFRFRPGGTLEVVVPEGKKIDVEAAIRERAPWIIREHQKMSRTKLVLSPGRVMYGGEELNLAYLHSATDSLSLDLLKKEVLASTSDRRNITELVRRWFLKESSAYAVRKVREYSPRLRVRPSRVDVREMGKWGYCTRGGRLSFSWQLIALPERLREYVVLHELTHLLEFNHSGAFRAKLRSVCPDFRDRAKELELIAPYDRLAPPF